MTPPALKFRCVHPTLDGFWIDNDNQYWLDNNLYAQIYQLHPNMTISNNNEDSPG